LAAGWLNQRRLINEPAADPSDTSPEIDPSWLIIYVVSVIDLCIIREGCVCKEYEIQM